MTEKFCLKKMRSGTRAGGTCGFPAVPGFGVCYRHADVEKMATKIGELEAERDRLLSTSSKQTVVRSEEFRGGGTLGPEALNNALSAVEYAKFPENRSGAAERLRQHIVAQGVRIAALESHLAAIRSTRWKCEHGHPIDLNVIVEACKP